MTVEMPHGTPEHLPLSSVAGYDVIGFLPPDAWGTALRVRNAQTGEQAELRFFPGPPSESVDPRVAARWREAVAVWHTALQAQQTLNGHSCWQRILSFGEVNEGFYTLLELLEGRSLRQVLEAEGAQPLKWTLPICAQSAAALDFAAARRLHHGALTPDSILLMEPLETEPGSGTDMVRLRRSHLAQPGRSSITAYTAPEQTLGKSSGALSDIYALGAVLYACLGGRPPFAAHGREELCRKIQSTSPAPLVDQPVWVRAIIARAMQRMPEHRYRVAVDIVTDLQFQRVPAPMKLDDADAPREDDWTLGKFIPAMALKDEPPPAAHQAEIKRVGGNLLARLRRQMEAAPTDAGSGMGLLQALRHPLQRLRRSAPAPAEEVPLPDARPEHGIPGRFNRYMALQEYVRLEGDDAEWRGIRGLLRCVGIRVPLPKPRPEASPPSRFALSARGAARLHRGWRMARVAAPLCVLALCAHAGLRVHQQRFAQIVDVHGQVTEQVEGDTIPLHVGDTLDGVDNPLLRTESGSGVTVQFTNARVILAPETTLRIGPLTYNGARAARVDLLRGQITAEMKSLANAENAAATPDSEASPAQEHLDIFCQDAQVRVLPAAIVRVTWQKEGTHIESARDKARVYALAHKRFVGVGQHLLLTPGRPPGQAASLPLSDSRRLAAQAEAAPPTPEGWRAFWNHLGGLYTDAQENTLMPLVDRALSACHLKPGEQSALDDARTFATARASLDMIVKSLSISMNGEAPAILDVQTLQETSLEQKTRDRMLEDFEGHRLLAYRRQENGSYTLLARVNNTAKTLLKASDGRVSIVPETQEEAEIAKAGNDSQE